MADAFLLVVPPGWTEINLAPEVIEQYGAASIQSEIQAGNLVAIYSILDVNNLMPPNKDVADAKFFDTGDDGAARYAFWVRFVDVTPA